MRILRSVVTLHSTAYTCVVTFCFTSFLSMNTRAILLLATLFVTVGCTPQPSTDGNSTTSSSEALSSDSSGSEQLPETNNVTYTGTVAGLSVTTTTDATHTLLLDSGRALLIVSTDGNLQLGSYLGKRVDVRGSLKVSGTENVLRISEVVVLESSAASSSKGQMCGGIAGFACPADMACIDDDSDSCDPMHGGADCSGVCVPAVATSSSSMAAVSSSLSSATAVLSSSSKAAVSSSSKSSSIAAVSSAASSVSANESDITLMAKQNYATPSLWTQKYCTGHIGFCIPVHKNWYYKSFGATTSTLWRVEFGMTDIQALGQGVIALNLIAGSSENAGGADGKVETKAGTVIGYKDWDGRHIEITADARLSEAVSYMLNEMQRFTPDE